MGFVKNIYFYLFILLVSIPAFILVGCQNKPTKIIQESANVFAIPTVLVDVRTAFEYESYHIPGSIRLSTEDFLILKDPKNKIRILDPDLPQLIERLAKRGIHPDRKIILLINDFKSLDNSATQSKESSVDSASVVEAKKWNWLLRKLDIDSVQIKTLSEFKQETKIKSFAEPQPLGIWSLKSSEDLIKEFLFKKSKDCFVRWNENICKSI